MGHLALIGFVIALVGGTPTNGDPAVVAVAGRRVACGDASAVTCTGILVAPRVVLTAAHCIEAAAPRGSYEVFFGADVTGVGRHIVVMAYERHPTDDIAVLLLAEDATVTPFPLPTGSIADAAPTSLVRAVGFGVSARAAADPGMKREGTLALDAVRERAFDATAAPAMTCVADSGGPVLAAIGGSEQLVGITSQGDFACETLATNARVDVVLDELVRPFIAQAATAPPGWLATAMPLDDVGVLPCVDDSDCPALMVCATGFSPEPHCQLNAVGLGRYGDTCTDASACDPGSPCVRVWPDGADACRCFTTGAPLPMEPGGCCSSNRAPNASTLAFAALVLALSGRCRRGGRRAARAAR